MKGFYPEMNMNGDLLNVSEYDDEWRKNGKCFEYEEGRLVRECEYKNGVMMRVLREWKGECMIEYDMNGMRVYEGGFEGDMMKGFVREGKGKEYGDDGNEFLYSTGYLNGTKDGKGRSLKSDISAINYVHVDPIKRFADGYGTDLSVFSCDCLKGIQKLEIGDGCFMNVNRFVIDGLNELKSVSIGMKSFYHDWGFVKKGSKCAIMNCNKLIEIYIGSWSINLYESFELKNLLSLISIQLDDYALMFCHAIVFESMNH